MRLSMFLALLPFAAICQVAQDFKSTSFYFELPYLVLTHSSTKEVNIIVEGSAVQYSLHRKNRTRKGTMEVIDSASIRVDGKTIGFSELEKIRIKGDTRMYRKDTKNHTFRPLIIPAVPNIVLVQMGTMITLQLATEAAASKNKKDNPYRYMTEWKIHKSVVRHNFQQ